MTRARCLMKVEDTKLKNSEKKVMMGQKGPAGGFYFLTYIGAAIHFVNNTEGFWNVILAFLKALVWPAFLINKVFDMLRI